MKLLELTMYNGEIVAINTKYITAMFPSYDEGKKYTMIVMNTGYEYTVTIGYEDLMRVLMKGKINES
jgi:hypothetical protein